MTDDKFQQLLYKLTYCHKKYLGYLSKAEDEYNRRYGNYPSEVEDDFWLDSFCGSAVGADVEDVEKNAMLRSKIKQ